jgi:colanic acid biosynthesis glycosyl transferase WcaI
MRFLLLTQYFPPEIGAAQTRLDALTNAIHRAGHEVDVVTAMPSYPLDSVLAEYRGRWFVREEDAGRRVVRTRAYPAMGTGLRRFLSYGVFSVSSLLGLFRSRRPDVLLIESPPLLLAVPGLLWARLRRIPVVFNVADLWPDAAVAVGALDDGLILKVLLRLEKWTYRHASLVSTVTDGVADKLLTVKLVPPDKLVMLPNGVDVERFSGAPATGEGRKGLGLTAHPFVVYAGTMGLVHGVEPLIDAFAILDEAGDQRTTLVMLGAGSERGALEQRVKARGLGNVVFRDAIPQDRLAAVLGDALAGVVTLADIPINRLARPAKMFPIMASGLPVLFAGSGEGAAIVERSGGGVVVENNPHVIADAVRQLCEDAAGRQAMGAAGRKYVLEHLSWDVLIASWLDRVGQLVEPR